MIEIDKGIQVPMKRRGRKAKNPFHKMEVGDSFLFETKNRTSASSMAGRAGRKLGIKLAVRKTEQGLRVWRVA